MRQVKLGQKIINAFSQWLLKNAPPKRAYLSDFQQICTKILPGDVLLVEGRSRISAFVKRVTQSPWSHAMLYIGHLQEITDPTLRNKITQYCQCQPETQLIVESEMGKGTIVNPIRNYENDHIRILRPGGLAAEDAEKVISYAIGRLGAHYSIRNVLDLFRILMPWTLLPQKWGAYLFQHSNSQTMEDICSSMIAEAFQSVHFPILPLVSLDSEKNIELTERNPRLFTPSDFDFSPYFSIIKYPIFPVEESAYYHNLPWKKEMRASNNKQYEDKGEGSGPLGG